MPLPEWLIYRKIDLHSEIEIRKLNNGDAGITITKELYDFPGTSHTESFINKSDAIELVEALREYFDI